MPVASNGVIAGLVHLTAHQCVERWLERWLRRRGEPGSAAQRPRGVRAAPRTATTRAARAQLDRLAPDMPAARSTSTRTLRVCVADCALLDRGLGRQRRFFQGMEPLFRVTTHVMAGGRGRERAGARFVAVPAPFAPCTRHCGEKAIFQRRFQFIWN